MKSIYVLYMTDWELLWVQAPLFFPDMLTFHFILFAFKMESNLSHVLARYKNGLAIIIARTSQKYFFRGYLNTYCNFISCVLMSVISDIFYRWKTVLNVSYNDHLQSPPKSKLLQTGVIAWPGQCPTAGITDITEPLYFFVSQPNFVSPSDTT
jgi:hypothetical protein